MQEELGLMKSCRFEIEDYPAYSEEQRQLYRNSVDKFKVELQARLKMLSQIWKDLQTQVVRIRQTIEKVFNKDTSLAKKIRILFGEQGITIFF